MVAYEDWISVGFRIAREKGFQPARPAQGRIASGGRGFAPGNANSELLSLLAEIWQERKGELRSASERDAERIADNELVIR